jgi:hypothetical protein
LGFEEYYTLIKNRLNLNLSNFSELQNNWAYIDIFTNFLMTHSYCDDTDEP